MPIAMSLFTPQVMLLLYLNIEMLGLARNDSFNGVDYTKILNFLMNKIFGMVKSIIIYVKNLLIEYLLFLFKKYVQPVLLSYTALIVYERIEYWLNILQKALGFLYSTYNLFDKKVNVISSIENVNYADIIIENNQNMPESTAIC
jgi:hypothetical protein